MTLREAVAARIARAMRRQTWFDLLDDSVRHELLQMRESYRSGEWGAAKLLTVAKSIRAELEERGIALCEARRLGEWLRGET